MNRPGLGQAGQRQDATAAFYSAILKNNGKWQPEWAGLKPGEHPMLPKWPPGRSRKV